jgi:hypothetical protein
MPMTNQPLPHRADRHPAPGLDRQVRAGRTEQRLALRAGIVLAAADGQPNVRIAASLGVCEDTARKWRHRWCAAPGVSSLVDANRSGRRPVFSPVQVAQVKAMPYTPPQEARPTVVPLVVPGTGPADRDRPRGCDGSLVVIVGRCRRTRG